MQVMHIPGTDAKILSLKVLDQKGFKCHIYGGQVCIMKNAETYTKAVLGSELYEVKMNIIPSQQSILAAIKRDSLAADLPTWHRQLGHLGEGSNKPLFIQKVAFHSSPSLIHMLL